MATDTTSAQLKAAIARLLAYSDDSGRDVADFVTDRLYVSQAPENAPHPYIVVRKASGATDPEYGNLLEEFELEIDCWGRPRHSKEQETELIADLCEGAMLTWHESSAVLGLTYGMSVERETLDNEQNPELRDIVGIRLRARVACWPRRLSNALT